MESFDWLYPFQLQNVHKAVSTFSGRVLIADEMGLGKTAQAIAMMIHYNEWPVVVVAPATLRLNWKAEILKFIPEWHDEYVCIVRTGKDPLYGRVMVFSYDLAAARYKEIALKNPQMIVLDESHYIKNPKAVRTRALIPVCRNTRRVVLLTGTPILNRPIELFAQLQAIGMEVGTYFQFAQRYCAAKKGRFGWDFTGASNLGELSQKLFAYCMVRNLKRDVLTELPEKTRVAVWVEGKTPAAEQEIRRYVQGLLAGGLDAEECFERTKRALSAEGVQENLFAAYQQVGLAKVEAACEWIEANAGEGQLVVFAHHKAVLNALEQFLPRETTLRIDGSTPTDERFARVKAFQEGKARVILLSITAASTGITLTAAKDMLIVELPWSPGTAMQAEDRIHRIGQDRGVLVRYLIAEKTMDEVLWRLIKKKASIQRRIVGQDVFGEDEHDSAGGGVWDILKELVNDEADKAGGDSDGECAAASGGTRDPLAL